MTKQRVLVFDIETAPMLAYVWGRREVNVALNQLKSDMHVIAWAAKWLGSPARSTMYRDQRDEKDITNDKVILSNLWTKLDEADIVVTQNGKAFDSKILNARFIMHGWAPPSPYKHLDTLQIARSAAKFTSNSLEYLTDKLCTKYKKLSHSKFPGMELWKECMAGNRKAWDEMKRYNIHDVLSTEELYMKLRAWAPANAPQVFQVNPDEECGTCGARDVHQRGWGYRKATRFKRMLCRDCGTWSIGKTEAL